MKAIFLDFDGVIRIPSPPSGGKIEAEFSTDRMKRVALLASQTGAKIVISSDWRQRFDREGMIDLLGPAIGEHLIHEDWATPVLSDTSPGSIEGSPIPRGAEVLTWLAHHSEIEHFLILDDMHSKHFPLMREQLVLCNLLEGFTEERFEFASNLLAVAG